MLSSLTSEAGRGPRALFPSMSTNGSNVKQRLVCQLPSYDGSENFTLEQWLLHGLGQYRAVYFAQHGGEMLLLSTSPDKSGYTRRGPTCRMVR